MYMSENKLKEFLNQNYGYIKTRDFEKMGISLCLKGF